MGSFPGFTDGQTEKGWGGGGQRYVNGWARCPWCYPGCLDSFHRTAATQLPGATSSREPFGSFLADTSGLGPCLWEPLASAGRDWEGASKLCPRSGKREILLAVCLDVSSSLDPHPSLDRVVNLLPSEEVGSYTHFAERAKKGSKKLSSHTSNYPTLYQWIPDVCDVRQIY